MSFPRYPAYMDSGVAWLGEVPGHWDVVQFKQFVDIQNGSDHKHVEQAEGYPVLGSGGVFTYASEFLYDGESVLLGRKGTIDKPLHISGRFWTVDTMYWTKISPDVSGRFTYYSALTIPFDFYLTNTALPSMTKGALSSHRVAFPPLLEQTQIATFLDRETAKIDALVAEQRRLMALLKEKRQAVISHAVTKGLPRHSREGGNPDSPGISEHPNALDSRLRGNDDAVPLKPSGIEWLGDVPEHWEVSAIKRYTDKITDGAHVSPETENGVFHFVSTKDVGGDSIDFENCLRTSEQSYESMVKAGCQPMLGDVLFSKDGTIGRTVVIREARDFVVASSLIIIRPTASVLDSDFLNCLCQSQGFANQVDCFVKGAGLPRLSIQNLTKVVGCFPPIGEQRVIAEFLGSESAKFDTLTTEAQRAIDLLQERRTALISAAVTGQIDVRGEL